LAGVVLVDGVVPVEHFSTLIPCDFHYNRLRYSCLSHVCGYRSPEILKDLSPFYSSYDNVMERSGSIDSVLSWYKYLNSIRIYVDSIFQTVNVWGVPELPPLCHACQQRPASRYPIMATTGC